MGKNTKINKMFIGSLVVNFIIFLSIIFTVGLIITILFCVKQSIEKYVALYIFGIIILLLSSLIFEQILEKKGKTKIFYKKFGICGYLYWVFIVCEVFSLTLYWVLTKLILSESKEGIYFFLYMGICVGTLGWFVVHLHNENTDYKALQMILQPFVLIVTIWGYIIDKFGSYKNWAIILATLYLAISFLVNLVDYVKEQKKKRVDIIVEKTDDGYDVIFNDDNKVKYHYKVTLKD